MLVTQLLRAWSITCELYLLLLKYSYLTSGRSAESFPAVTMYALVRVEGTPGSIQTTQSESLRLTITLRILSSFHSSCWIETVTTPVFNRAGTAKVGGPSMVKLARFSSVLLAFTQQINNRAEPY